MARHFAAASALPGPEDIATRLLGSPYAALDPTGQKVALHVAQRRHIARDPAHHEKASATTGQRAADAVASFGGSWFFVGLFVLLASRGQTFDACPYILLNPFLSMLAAVQAPVIPDVTEPQAEKDRLGAEHDYEINLKAELEVMHEKLDTLRKTQWQELVELQHEQLRWLAALARATEPQSQGAGVSAVRRRRLLGALSNSAARVQRTVG